MSAVWRLLITPPGRGAWNMAVDEAILERVGAGESLPTLRLYAWDPPCLSLGQAQAFADVDSARLAASHWQVVRRPTGGRAILHTDELTYSVCAPPDEGRVAGSILDSYQRLAGALLGALTSLGLAVQMQENAGAGQAAPNPVCFEVPSAFELTVNGRKLIGSAQARRREGVLQHGSLPLSGDLARITQALVFADETARQATARRLLRRATTLEAALGRPVSWEAAAQAFLHGFESTLDLTFESGELERAEALRAESLVREKYDHPEWTRRV
jgi:lipoyl(octanoyl) transferase